MNSKNRLFLLNVLKGACEVKNFKKIAFWSTPVLLALALFCSNPTDQTLKWRSKIELPVSNQKFIVGKELNHLIKLDSNLAITGTGDTNPDGTNSIIQPVGFTFHQKDSMIMEQTQEVMGEKVFSDNLGPLPLSGLAPMTLKIPLIAGAVNANVPLSINDTIKYPQVRSVSFHPQSGSLLIKISDSSDVAIDNISVTITSLSGSQAVLAGSLEANQSTTISYPVAGQTMDSTIAFLVTGTIRAPGTVAAGQSLQVTVMTDSVTALSAIVKDSAIAFTKVFTNHYKITDTVAIDYVDCGNGFYNYKMNNASGLDVNLSMIHENIWRQDFCTNRANQITSLADLSSVGLTKSDSDSYFWGNRAAGAQVLPFNAHANSNIGILDLSLKRLFPEWDTIKQQSISTVHYYVSTRPSGKWDTVSAGDSVVFTISPDHVDYQQMYGTVMAAYQKDGDPRTDPIQFPWRKSVKDSLKGRFFLNSAYVLSAMDIALPDSAFIDSFRIKFTAFDPKTPAVACSTFSVFHNVHNKSRLADSIDITKIVNLFPDSISTRVHAEIPIGTKMLIVNNMQSFGQVQGGMRMKGDMQDSLKAPLGWSVSNDLIMDLGTGFFAIPQGLDVFKRMKDRIAAFEMTLTNRSNVDATVYALVDPKPGRRSLLDSLTTAQICSMVFAPAGTAEDSGYVNLLGSQGVLIPARDSVTEDSININDRQMNSILQTDTCYWRWMLKFYKKSSDVLLDTDNVYIKSRIRIEGVNSMNNIVQ